MTERIAYRITEFAKAIGVDRVTVWRWIKAGKLEAFKIGGTTLICTPIPTPVSGRNTAQLRATPCNSARAQSSVVPKEMQRGATQ